MKKCIQNLKNVVESNGKCPDSREGEIRMKRVFLIVLDSFGIGEEPDAAAFGDVNVNTLRSVAGSPFFRVPNLWKLGLFNIDGVTVMEKNDSPIGSYGRLREKSMGKDTTIGHWEIAGVVSPKPLPTYPKGFPREILDEFSRRTGRGVLCNRPYSGTAVIQEYGNRHLETGDLIVYTSADSVFQIAAHEEVVPLEELYEDCRIAREILKGEHGVGRVIARPFIGPKDGPFTRTAHRHDFSLLPPKDTMLDHLKKAGKEVLAVGKIQDIFAGQGITEHVYTSGNAEGIERTLEWMDRDFEGLCFVNLVDFDMLYGHRRDVDGYAKALTYFDEKLPEMMKKVGPEDALMITADHGCDPAYLATTDHTREYVPFLVYAPSIAPVNFGTRETFADVAATVLALLGTKGETAGKPLL